MNIMEAIAPVKMAGGEKDVINVSMDTTISL